jgi:iron complex outermembrane receptor protein
MVKILPIAKASDTERTGYGLLPLKLIKQGILIAPLLMGNAYAGGDPAYTFNLPSQPLSATLDSVARSSHTKLIYADATVKGLRAAPVKGKYTARQALDIALGKIGLDYKVVDKTLITVAGKPVPASPVVSPASAITLKPMTVVGEAVQDPNSPYNEAYEVTNSSTATKTDTPVMETPISIQTVTKQVMRDQQVIRVAKALENVSGGLHQYRYRRFVGYLQCARFPFLRYLSKRYALARCFVCHW